MSEQAGEGPRFRDPTELTRWVRWLLYAQVAIAVASLFSEVAEYFVIRMIRDHAFSSVAAMMDAANTTDLARGIVGLVLVVVAVISGVAILMWIFRANKNARALGADLQISAGWSAGWYFIPFANLVMPYIAMKQIWQGSADPQAWREVPRPALLPWWWFLWIATNVTGNVSFRLTLNDDVDSLVAAGIVGAVSDLFAIPLALVFLAIVNGIYTMQMARSGTAVPPANTAGPIIS